MEMRNYLYAIGVGIALASCSSEEGPTPAFDDGNDNFSDKYVSVSILTPAGSGTRTDNDGNHSANDYESGTTAENAVTSAAFFFFDKSGNRVDIQVHSDLAATTVTDQDLNPAVEEVAEKEIRLREGLDYSQIVVVLNPTLSAVTDMQNNAKTLSDVQEYVADYAAKANAASPTFTMSNSVYYEGENTHTAPTGNPVVAVKINAENIYTDADKKNGNVFGEGSTKKKVDVYVERTVAKVKIGSVASLASNYAVEEGDNGIMTIYDENNQPVKIEISYNITGVGVNVLAPTAIIVKPLANVIGYNKSEYSGFEWNDPTNFRSYWATTPSFSASDYQYKSWNEITGTGGSYSLYINPNTQDYSDADGTDASKNTKVMVRAELQYNEEGSTEKKALDLVRFGSDYKLSSTLMTLVANDATNAVKSITEVDGVSNDVLANALKDFKFGSSQFNLVSMGTATSKDNVKKYVTDAYKAKVVYNGAEDYGLSIDDAEVKAKVAAAIKEKLEGNAETELDGVLGDYNSHDIFYWKGGKTYFYTPIRQSGFKGLTDAKPLYGVVRNHVYDVQITGLYGLGTPVIDPDEPINPERPSDVVASYMTAQIKVLKWRVVKNNVTVH